MRSKMWSNVVSRDMLIVAEFSTHNMKLFDRKPTAEGLYFPLGTNFQELHALPLMGQVCENDQKSAVLQSKQLVVNCRIPQNAMGSYRTQIGGQGWLGVADWCIWACLGNDWANRGPGGFPWLAPALLCRLIHSNELQPNTKRHRVSSDNKAESGGHKVNPAAQIGEIDAKKIVCDCRTGRREQRKH